MNTSQFIVSKIFKKKKRDFGSPFICFLMGLKISNDRINSFFWLIYVNVTGKSHIKAVCKLLTWYYHLFCRGYPDGEWTDLKRPKKEDLSVH
ncbi:MAG: hypothetical protein EA359_02260 [Balneolaceae bacterium]|nr:MAG: hypothetical protein EA359_02260 [Balneolaceae bacterium]